MIQDENLTQAISELLLTLQEATSQLLKFAEAEDRQSFDIVADDLMAGIKRIGEVSASFKEQDPNIRLTDACKCAYDSLKRIIKYCQNEDWLKVTRKLEFELMPMLEVAYMQFRYWGCAYPDKEKIERYKTEELAHFSMNRYVEQAEKTGEYKYELSIIVVAYNKLEYTRQCVESLLKYMPQDISYELILFNHGSSDGTKEYFESIKPDKQVDISINGAVPAIATRLVEGKYYLSVSNDVIVTENAVLNLLRCIKRDPQISWVVPSTPNVSNLQTISANYNNLEEMHRFAANNNQYNINRHEQRTRLCNPIVLAKSKAEVEVMKEMYVPIYCTSNIQSFPDDKYSIWYRRNGYKLILAKDAYCYHFGSVTLKDEITQEKEQQFYLQGRQAFYQEYGVDPWGVGFCYDPQLIEKLPCSETEAVNILGIDCGLGSNPLKIKETIKENTGNLAVTIHQAIHDERFAADLRGVSDKVSIYHNQQELKRIMSAAVFQYIVVESGGEHQRQPVLWLKSLQNRLTEGGRLCVKTDSNDLRKTLKNKFKKMQTAGSWLIIENN